MEGSGDTHKYPTKVLSVDIDADWKARQVVEPCKDMQSWAIVAIGAERSDNSTVLILGCEELFLALCRRSICVVC